MEAIFERVVVVPSHNCAEEQDVKHVLPERSASRTAATVKSVVIGARNSSGLRFL